MVVTMLAHDNTGIMNGDIVTVSIATVGEWNFIKCAYEKNLDMDTMFSYIDESLDNMVDKFDWDNMIW